MAKVHPLETELSKATKIKPGAKEKRQTFLKRLLHAVSDQDEFPQEAWDNLSEEAQEWQVAATKASDDDQEIPDFDEVAKKDEGKKKAKAKKGDDDEDAGEDAEDGEKSEAKDDSDETEEAEEAEEEKVATKKSKKSKEKPAKAKTKSANKVGAKGDGYKGHRKGSRKETIHQVFDKSGEEAAVKKAEALKIKTGTVRSWMSKWKRKK